LELEEVETLIRHNHLKEAILFLMTKPQKAADKADNQREHNMMVILGEVVAVEKQPRTSKLMVVADIAARETQAVETPTIYKTLTLRVEAAEQEQQEQTQPTDTIVVMAAQE
jgi:hypothetical protein